MSIPIINNGDRNFNQLQLNINSALSPIQSNPVVNGILVQNVALNIGSNVVNHGLGQTLTGWFITRMRDAYSQVYDTQSSNNNPSQTLFLNSSVKVTVDVFVF